MKSLKTIKFTILAFALTLCMATKAQQTDHEYIVKTNYLLYLPDDYGEDTTKVWPLMIHLHGVGESGHDINVLRGHGIPWLIDQGKKFPFIVLSPQSPQRGWRSSSVLPILEEVKENHKIDEDRIYLTGLSMGGGGTWSLAQDFPGIFAAIIPICGWGDPSRTWSLENTPIWCFHGAKDDNVDISSSQVMIDSVKQYNDNVKFTIYPEGGHDAWSETYANEKVFEWMLEQKLFKYKEINLSEEKLARFEGMFLDKERNDTITIKSLPEQNCLEVGRPQYQWVNFMKPLAENDFFAEEYFLRMNFKEEDGKIATIEERNTHQRRMWTRID